MDMSIYGSLKSYDPYTVPLGKDLSEGKGKSVCVSFIEP